MKVLVAALAVVVLLSGCAGSPGLPNLVWRQAGDPASRYSGVQEAPLVIPTQITTQQPMVYQQRVYQLEK